MTKTLKMTVAILAVLSILLTCAACAFKKETQRGTNAAGAHDAESAVTVDEAGATVITLNGTTADVSGAGAETDEIYNTLNQDRCFAATGSGKDQNRAFGSKDGLTLHLIQGRKIVLQPGPTGREVFSFHFVVIHVRHSNTFSYTLQARNLFIF